MREEQEFTAEKMERPKPGYLAYAYVFFVRLSEYVFDAVEEYIEIMRREATLFAGTFFVIVGMLSFSSNKYCDGNTAEYLSCTRPTTYYYYGSFQIALVILGVFLVLLWVLKRREH
jgi:SNF family Na+-dependent transporter